jgi:archaellum component FlaC
MADLDNIVLEHLRHINSATDGVRDDIHEIKQRVGNLENQYANMSNRLDRIDVRIERIERRLDLTGA